MSLSWYPFYVGDYIKKTAHLSMMEHGAYRMLIDHYMSTGHPLPNDPTKLYRICRARSPSERKAVLSVTSEFFIEDLCFIRHNKCDSELSKRLNYSESQSAKAKLRHSHGNIPENSSKELKNSRSWRHDFDSESSHPDDDKDMKNKDSPPAAALPVRARLQPHTESKEEREKSYEKGNQSKWQTEGTRLVEKYTKDAQREREGAVDNSPDPNLRITEAIRKDPG